jgi:hypothetical protein
MAAIDKAGDYRVRVTEAELTENQSGQPQVFVRLETTDGTGRSIGWWMGLDTEKAQKYTMASLRGLGFEGYDLSTISVETLTEEVTARVIEDNYNGKTRLKVQYVDGPKSPPRESGVKPMDVSKKQLLAEKMKAKLAALEAASGGASEAAGSGGPGPGIPF